MKKRLFMMFTSLLMVACLLSTMCLSFAEGGVIDPSDGDEGEYTDEEGEGAERSGVVFLPGEGYTLKEKEGTERKKDGSVVVTPNPATGRVGERFIPDVIPEDAYYAFDGWAILKPDRQLEPLENILEYRFPQSPQTRVVAVMNDTWPPYLDMKQDRSDWYYKYVRDLSIAGVVNGYPGYLFEPNGLTTWGEALKLIMRATGYPEQAPTEKHWASGYLTKARADELVPAELEIDLDKTITRGEYARVAAAALGLKPVDIQSPFADTDEMAILELYSIKIVEGDFNAAGVRVFRPDDNIIRSEMCAVIWRIYNYQKTLEA